MKRKPFQGVTNIIRFNWHYYIVAFGLIGILIYAISDLSYSLKIAVLVGLVLASISILVSLGVSFYIYDISNLYSLSWLDFLKIQPHHILVNIHAGFDETSSLLHSKYPDSILKVFDFYDPQKHTEIAIERARKAYPPFPDTQIITTSDIPFKPNSIDFIFLILSAHEIRNHQERIGFFNQLSNALYPDGRIIVTEHQRDFSNFMAYTFGFFHFFSKSIWKKTFTSAGLIIVSQLKITPFITTYILKRHGTPS